MEDLLLSGERANPILHQFSNARNQVPSVLAGTLVTGMYLEAKYNFGDDLRVLSKIKRARNAYFQAEKQNRISMWYALSETCKRQWNNRAIWFRERSLTFGALYLEVTQYANWLLEQGVRPGDAVALYMKNCPEFIILWFATVCIGAFPALVNYNLEAETLLHCLEICETKLLLTSADKDCQDRIERWQKSIEAKSIRIINIEETVRQDIARMRLEAPCDSYRDSVTGDTPFCLVFTR
ncbi:hypothetical protein NW762_006116 [Fusarium torreyae]|uniref:AMP-dependent synthetase/ligase domain-containing protein n=1 Tax=Fusarium torreyae TaxID=1237075 RepID=A0A9W8VE23_9HYPO|nr:hypothetical protein NW762_006116 [Fusarium torreyae]